MVIILFLILGIFGLIIGSFLGVVVARVPEKKSIIHHRSRCDYCQKQLQWFDLIPVISYVSLTGKCRYCHASYGIEKLLIEIATCILFILMGAVFFKEVPLDNALSFLILFQFVYYLYIISCFISICFIDIKYGIIPNVIVYPALGVSLLYLLLVYPHMLFPHILAGFAAGGFFILLFLITKGRGMGFGDVKLALLLGIVLGFPQIVIALYCAFLTGAFLACILVLGKKKKFHGGTIPFGPFLVFGGIVSLFYGTFLLEKIFQFL